MTITEFKYLKYPSGTEVSNNWLALKGVLLPLWVECANCIRPVGRLLIRVNFPTNSGVTWSPTYLKQLSQTFSMKQCLRSGIIFLGSSSISKATTVTLQVDLPIELKSLWSALRQLQTGFDSLSMVEIVIFQVSSNGDTVGERCSITRWVKIPP